MHYCAYRTWRGAPLSETHEKRREKAAPDASNQTSTSMAFAEAVGRLVRRGRARRGITRRQLATDSGISERYLAQIEGGYGNPSLTVLKAVADALESPITAHVDLLLIHWPNPDIPPEIYIPALCKAKRNGQTRHIGVANFTMALLEEAEKLADEPIVNNQIETHPFLDHRTILAYCKGRGISVTGYCPLGRGRIPGNAVLERIAKTHNKSEAQIALRFLVQEGVIPIPRTATPDKLKANVDIFDFMLAESEMTAIRNLAEPDGRIVKPAQSPKWDS